MAGDELKALMREVPQPVSVVTVDAEGQKAGLTVVSLVSLSLEPPLVGIAVGRHAALHELLREAGAFAVSILATEQEALAQHFARGVPPIVLWHGIETHTGELGAPLLEGALGVDRMPPRLRAPGRRSHLLRRRRHLGRARSGPGGARAPPAGIHVIEAVVFDLDGVLLDTEELWDEARREFVEERGGHWPEDAQRTMMGMSSEEWSRHMHEELGIANPPERISAEVVRRLENLYRERLPLIPGALDAVRRLAARWPLAIASSSNRPLIDLFLELTGTADLFRATVSSEEVERGKPAPDVYLEAARRLGVDPARCVAVEDSENGIRSAAAAGIKVIAIPNPVFPPSGEALLAAAVVAASLDELEPMLVESLA